MKLCGSLASSSSPSLWSLTISHKYFAQWCGDGNSCAWSSGLVQIKTLERIICSFWRSSNDINYFNISRCGELSLEMFYGLLNSVCRFLFICNANQLSCLLIFSQQHVCFFLPPMFFWEVRMNISCVFHRDLTFSQGEKHSLGHILWERNTLPPFTRAIKHVFTSLWRVPKRCTAIAFETPCQLTCSLTLFITDHYIIFHQTV